MSTITISKQQLVTNDESFNSKLQDDNIFQQAANSTCLYCNQSLGLGINYMRNGCYISVANRGKHTKIYACVDDCCKDFVARYNRNVDTRADNWRDRLFDGCTLRLYDINEDDVTLINKYTYKRLYIIKYSHILTKLNTFAEYLIIINVRLDCVIDISNVMHNYFYAMLRTAIKLNLSKTLVAYNIDNITERSDSVIYVSSYRTLDVSLFPNAIAYKINDKYTISNMTESPFYHIFTSKDFVDAPDYIFKAVRNTLNDLKRFGHTKRAI